MADNKEALKELLKLTHDFKNGAINAPEYFKESRIIIYNEIALYYYKNELDLIQDILQVVFNNRQDILKNRILIDLKIKEVNFTIEKIN